MSLSFIPTGKPVGAEVRGVDLNQDLDDATIAALRDGLHQYGLLVLRGQDISPQRQVEFTRHFGPMNPPRPESQWQVPGHPEVTRLSNIYENGQAIGLLEAGQYWHTDRVYDALPNGYAFLHAVEVPHDNAGRPLGSTLYVNTAFAWDALDPAMQQRLAGLRATHHLARNRGKHAKAYESFEDKLPPVAHPVMRTHPVTGRKCLYVNEQYTTGIVGMAEAEARPLIDALCAHITRPEFIHTHVWQVNDLLIWDDCMVQHHAIGDYQPHQRRLMYRTSVAGTVPM